MANDYEFITFADLDQMRESSTISQIRRHAMKDVGASRRLPHSRRSKQRKLLPVPRQDPPAAHHRPSPLPAAHGVLVSQDAKSTDGSNTLPSSRASPEETHQLDACALQNPSARALSCEPDPFDSGPITIDNTVYTLIQYYIYHYHENGNWLYETASLPPDWLRLRQHIRRTADLAFKDEFTMHCLLSVTSSRMRSRDHVRTLSVQRYRHFSMYKALQMLQSHINVFSPTDTQRTIHQIFCISMLAASEAFGGDLPAARAHLSALSMLLRLIGGAKSIQNDYIRGVVLALDAVMACQTLQPCLIDCDFDPGAMSENPSLRRWCGDHSGQAFGAALLQRDDQSVSPTFKNAVWSLAEVEVVRIRVASEPESMKAIEAGSWIRTRTAALRIALLAIETSLATARALKIALIMFTLLPDHDLTRASLASSLAKKLRETLQACTSSDWAAREDIKLWITLIGYCCAHGSDEERFWFFRSVTRAWVAIETRLAARSVHRTTFEMLLEFQRHFLLHNPRQRPLTEQLAQYLDA